MSPCKSRWAQRHWNPMNVVLLRVFNDINNPYVVDGKQAVQQLGASHSILGFASIAQSTHKSSSIPCPAVRKLHIDSAIEPENLLSSNKSSVSIES